MEIGAVPYIRTDIMYKARFDISHRDKDRSKEAFRMVRGEASQKTATPIISTSVELD